ncbi:hypothetical protein SFMTTN_0108 [Sulfuriferula multivorans]|uniref:Uncharacterized protein n=1 Tax=Sulfuriferula multivorans TaxID=1559896 RepID=A0A401J9K0_9PROT|nr:hypothetical protein [Sulfuriferula multivorans]GBL44313.1 hypothetical protein SFMTTN_0108 [Sulfuriferula multivorans]
MIIIRLLFVLTLLALVVSGGLYLFTGDRRYVQFVWNVLKFGVVLVLIFGALVVAERFLML